MKYIIVLLVSAAVFCSCTQSVKYDARLSGIIRELDETIARKDTYGQIKEQRIDGIKSLLRNTNTLEHTYNIYDNLFQEYYRYNLDTAMVYANRKLLLAEEMGNSHLKNKSLLDIAEVFIMAGMLIEAQEQLHKVPHNPLDSVLMLDYYGSYHNLYKEMRAICAYPSLTDFYDGISGEYRSKVYKLVKGDWIRTLFIEASMKRRDGDNQGIVDSLVAPFEEADISLHNKAGLAYVIARAYHEMGDLDNAIYYYATSSIYDIKTPVHEHVAMYKLANLLYDRGDMKRAYHYINCSIDDAMLVNSRKNIFQINQLLPLISQSYNAQMHQQQNRLIALVVGISFLTLLLILAVIIVYSALKRISAAKKEQNRTNEELQKVNSKLINTNNTLLESNKIKEAYIGRYLDLCSNYINGVEQYRAHLNNILRKDGSTEVVKSIKSSTYIKDELDEFYSNFDVTFLHIFPDFVEQFNNLLQEDKRITLKQGELLNTELRVFALIRLGITDSIKIAEFLRRSTSTIYNYRVKMRNAAVNDRQDFEKQVMHLG